MSRGSVPPRGVAEDARALCGLTARRRQLGLSVGDVARKLDVCRTEFFDGPAAERGVRRMVGAPEQWAVYAHRQAIDVVQIQGVEQTRLQEDLWERFVYQRVDGGDGWATYGLVG